MARITRVQKAQQRYEQVPVLNEDGTPKQTPVMSRHGTQKVTKRGKPVFMTVTVQDRTKPLPNRKCGKCGKEIEVGSPYKHISPRSGPYGGRTLYRCKSCPDWHVWEYSGSLSARLAEIDFNFTEELDAEFEDTDYVQDALNTAAEAVREIAGEKTEAADNIENGFQHATYQSDELRDQGEQLESWADEIESADIPELPEPEETECEPCDGTGNRDLQEQLTAARQRLAALMDKPLTDQDVHAITLRHIRQNEKLIQELEQRAKDGDTTVECEECDGAGMVTPEEPTPDQMDEWRQEVRDSLTIVGEPPV